ncbi:YraN family protein [Caldanaerobacter sp.]|uniref:YraN family protein n=1 Tax=Caldanaerobacter sp. TaxID=2930036 RepID=UPI003C72563C
MNKKAIGSQGEKIAAQYLQKKGYKILEKNFKCKIGEIDLIALYKGQIIFVEVKTRTSMNFGIPSEAVNFSKQQKILKIAQVYMSISNYKHFQPRFDIIEIYLNHSTLTLEKLNHIPNAFF